MNSLLPLTMNALGMLVHRHCTLLDWWIHYAQLRNGRHRPLQSEVLIAESIHAWIPYLVANSSITKNQLDRRLSHLYFIGHPMLKALVSALLSVVLVPALLQPWPRHHAGQNHSSDLSILPCLAVPPHFAALHPEQQNCSVATTTRETMKYWRGNTWKLAKWCRRVKKELDEGWKEMERWLFSYSIALVQAKVDA